jgi:hypothetical protein
MPRTIVIFFALLLVLCPASFSADTEGGYVQDFEMQQGKGSIDWESGYVTATGIGMAPPGASSKAQARALALRAATVTARRNLLEIVKDVHIDSTTTIRNNMVADDTVESVIRGKLHNSRILDTAYMSDGTVQVTVGFSQRGELADAVLPKKPEFKSGAVKQASGEEDEEEYRPLSGGPYTGLLVDARGLSLRPALTPRILDPEGEVVYGKDYVSREYAVSQGMAGYAVSLASAFNNQRVGENPLMIEAVKTAGAAGTDMVVSESDAGLVRSLAREGDVLEKCRVMVILGKSGG